MSSELIDEYHAAVQEIEETTRVLSEKRGEISDLESAVHRATARRKSAVGALQRAGLKVPRRDSN
jgi:hypothetical protein